MVESLLTYQQTTNDSYPNLFDRDIEFDYVCSSSYSLGELYQNGVDILDWNYIDKHELIKVQSHNTGQSIEEMQNTLNRSRANFDLQSVIHNDYYHTVFFQSINKMEWVGFITFTLDDDIANGERHINVELYYIFVKPKYRNGTLSHIMAYDLGRTISEKFVYDNSHARSDIRSIDVEVRGEPISKSGEGCLLSFYKGIWFHLSDNIEVYIDDDESVIIPSSVHYCNEV